MHLPACFNFSTTSYLPSIPSLSSLSLLVSDVITSLSSRLSLPTLPTLASLLQHPKVLSIATLFDDEQQLLNRIWSILLGLEALLVLFGIVSAIVRSIVSVRRSRPGGLRQAGSSDDGQLRQVKIVSPVPVFATEFEDPPQMSLDAHQSSSHSLDGDYFAAEKFHTPIRSRTPGRVFHSPSFKV